VPNVDALPSLEDLHEVESVRLFVARAQAVRDNFELTDDNAQHVVEICRRVDALPLAIELAASRVRTMSTERLLAALEQRFKVLTGGADDLLDHQKSLRELIAWSYDLLDESEQRLWRRLAVFSGGCEIKAAQEVCDPDDEYLIEVDIASLIDKSLVNVKLDPGSTDTRITMLESLRQYAREQLDDSNESELIQDRFRRWCVGVGFTDEETAMGSDFEEHLNQMDTEQNNVRAALEHCESERHADTALRLCGGLYQYWFTRGLFSEGIRWTEKALDLDNDNLTTARGRALKGLSTLLREQNRLDDALRHANEALEIYSSRFKDDKMRASVLCELSLIAQRRGDFDGANTYLDECIALARAESVSDLNMSFFLIVRGISEHLKGDLPAAKKFYLEGLSIGRDAGDKTRTANALVNLGEIIEAEGQYSEAYSHYRDSLKLWSDLQHKAAIAGCAEMIGGLEVRVNDRPSEAAFLFGAAEAIREELHVPVESFNLGRIEDDIRRTRQAIDQDEYLTAWGAGRSLGVDGVLRHVLGDT
jgi:non-specific serine/threonine protein kinase